MHFDLHMSKKSSTFAGKLTKSNTLCLHNQTSSNWLNVAFP